MGKLAVLSLTIFHPPARLFVDVGKLATVTISAALNFIVEIALL